MQRWWLSDSIGTNKPKNQSQRIAKKHEDDKDTSSFELWKFKVFVNFELNQYGKYCFVF